MQTFVLPYNKTFVMFAPQFSHSVMKTGSTCQQCHATEAVAQAQSNTVKLPWLDQGEVRQATGAIPVASGVRCGLVFQDYKDGKWSVISNPVEPQIRYAGFGEPLSEAQLERLSEPQQNK